ncbi:hypothetical protein GCM10020331_042010 [Ectobacillus funiculus]
MYQPAIRFDLSDQRRTVMLSMPILRKKTVVSARHRSRILCWPGFFLYQGAIALLATQIHTFVPKEIMDQLIVELTATGGALLIAIGLNILKKSRLFAWLICCQACYVR